MIDIRRRNYLWLNLVSTGSALLIALLLLLGYHWFSQRDDLRNNLTMQANLLGANLTAAIVFEDDRTAADIIGTLNSSPIILEAAVYRLDGSLLASFQRPRAPPKLADRGSPYGHVFSSNELLLSVPVQMDGQIVGSIALRAWLDDLYRDLRRIFGSMLVILAVSAAFGTYASRQMRLKMAATEYEIERMALYDRVTGLSNRHAFELGLTQTLQRHGRDGGGSALLFIDVDDFKKVNDLFGHQVGDAVLKTVGERLGKALRGADILARIGGDEFAVILTNTSTPNDAAYVADNLVRIAAEPFDTGSALAHIGFSIGICMIPKDGANIENALRNADLAMYHAKKSGKNTRQFFSESIGETTRRGLDIEAGLRLALTNEQLYVVYQPQRAVRSGRIEGLEALVRWRHPEWGIIAPAEFIPVAEETSLIQDIGRKVLNYVCRDIAELRDSGYLVPPVAVNVSALQVTQGKIGDDIRAALEEYRLKPDSIKIELTESVFIGHLESHTRILQDLRSAGIDIAIDDFGTGYSSLAYLHHLPVSILKIDMRFIRDLPDDAEALALVKGLIAMGHAVDLLLIAEGVESAAQAECLEQAGCDFLQGYHVGLPLLKQEIVKLLQTD